MRRIRPHSHETGKDRQKDWILAAQSWRQGEHFQNPRQDDVSVKGTRYELLGRLCPNTTGAELRPVCTEAGMFAVRDRRKAIIEKDLIQAIDKVFKGYKKFSATGKYMVYNWWTIQSTFTSLSPDSPLRYLLL